MIILVIVAVKSINMLADHVAIIVGFVDVIIAVTVVISIYPFILFVIIFYLDSSSQQASIAYEEIRGARGSDI